METFRRPASRYYSSSAPRMEAEPPPQAEEERAERPASRISPSIMIGAKTVAGIGIGLVTIVAGSALIGLAAETVLIPSLLLKLAGGIAGGGVGMAKGLQDVNKDHR
jgi:hypothetical protein